MASDLKFMAILGARDDEGLVQPCLENLRRIGFQKVVLFCVEGFAAKAPQLRAQVEHDPGISIVAVPKPVTDKGFLDLAGTVMGPYIQEFAPDWLYAGDIDEFPVVRGGNIGAIEGLDSADLIVFKRYNYARRKNETENDILARFERLQDLPLIAAQQNEIPNDSYSTQPRWSMHKIAPKVLIRPAKFSHLSAGFHMPEGWLGSATDKPTELRSSEVVIVHLPFTSFERFDQKVRNAQVNLANSKILKGRAAWHWKWWVRRLEEDALAEEFAREALGDVEFEELVVSRGVQTVRELLGS